MNFIISADTDKGTVKQFNQDSLTVKTVRSALGEMVLAVMCDGMGGLEKGEMASASVIKQFEKWLLEELGKLCQNGRLNGQAVCVQWSELIRSMNEKLKNYGASQGIRLGTTLTALLLTQQEYVLMNVGDSRAYEILEQEGIRQLTKDQTFIAREIELGHMTYEQGMKDERRNVLLQCIGASDEVYPDTFFGKTRTNAVYMLCSDGFRHEISNDEIFQALKPSVMLSEEEMRSNCRTLININMERRERDNISVIVIRTY